MRFAGGASTGVPSGPWVGSQRRFVLVASSVGAVLMVVAWVGSAATESPTTQTKFGILGVLVLAVGFTLAAGWIMVGRRAVGQRTRLLLGDAPRPGAPSQISSRPAQGGDGLVAGPGLRRYHMAGCAFAAGRDWQPMSRGSHELEGRIPCTICGAGNG